MPPAALGEDEIGDCQSTPGFVANWRHAAQLGPQLFMGNGVIHGGECRADLSGHALPSVGAQTSSGQEPG